MDYCLWPCAGTLLPYYYKHLYDQDNILAISSADIYYSEVTCLKVHSKPGAQVMDFKRSTISINCGCNCRYQILKCCSSNSMYHINPMFIIKNCKTLKTSTLSFTILGVMRNTCQGPYITLKTWKKLPLGHKTLRVHHAFHPQSDPKQSFCAISKVTSIFAE